MRRELRWAGEIRPHPLVLYAQPILQLRKRQHVNECPHQPGQEAARAQPASLQDCIIPAHDGHVALVEITDILEFLVFTEWGTPSERGKFLPHRTAGLFSNNPDRSRLVMDGPPAHALDAANARRGLIRSPAIGVGLTFPHKAYVGGEILARMLTTLPAIGLMIDSIRAARARRAWAFSSLYGCHPCNSVPHYSLCNIGSNPSTTHQRTSGPA
jgi:hypothetical protein